MPRGPRRNLSNTAGRPGTASTWTMRRRWPEKKGEHPSTRVQFLEVIKERTKDDVQAILMYVLITYKEHQENGLQLGPVPCVEVQLSEIHCEQFVNSPLGSQRVTDFYFVRV
ncbi:hypothetical protein HPB47_015156 [Ixodes persulcatus]|uniref:Uncharacterized protein n=1 Tax=Ixodes persulcatus TaxID=34615 RepID=A0AC60QXS5_IXOPE|nr:hypothetical protein HPB47_015156 [Ixodes persulcatus]